MPHDDLWNDQPLAYDTKLDCWLRVEGLLPPGALFNDAGVCVIGDRIYVAGGEGPFGSQINYFLNGKIAPDEYPSTTHGPQHSAHRSIGERGREDHAAYVRLLWHWRPPVCAGPGAGG